MLVNCREVHFVIVCSCVIFVFHPCTGSSNVSLRTGVGVNLDINGDKEYRPTHRPKGTKRPPCQTRQRFVKETFDGYESYSVISTLVNVRSPERYTLERTHTREDKVVETMSKQEKTQMDKLMEMFMRMREDDRKEKEQERLIREEEQTLREEKRLRNGKKGNNLDRGKTESTGRGETGGKTNTTFTSAQRSSGSGTSDSADNATQVTPYE